MNWQILINNLSLGGYAPAYWKSTYGSYGNNNMAISMSSSDLINPSYLTQGPGLTVITGTVTDLIRGIHPTVVSANKTYGIGSDGIYDITATAVSLVATIGAATGEDVALYAGHAKFSYGTNVVDYDLGSQWNKSWWTAVAGGGALTSGVPHPTEVAGTSGVFYVANGRYVAQWNGTTADDDAFDTKDSDSVICDIRWNQNRLWIAANKPNVSGRNEGSIYSWDGNAISWENQIKIEGEIGSLYVKNGVTYVFYKKNLSQGVCTLGYVDGIQIKDLTNYYGSLPKYYQVTEYEDFILWVSGTDGKTFAFGAGDNSLNGRLFQLSQAGTGGIANPFGTPIFAYTTSVKKFSGYDKNSYWKSVQYDVTGDGKESMIDEISFNIEVMATGAGLTWSLVNNRGITKSTDTITYTKNGTNTHIEFTPKCKTDNFRMELAFSNGSTSNPVCIKSIKIKGHSLQ